MKIIETIGITPSIKNEKKILKKIEIALDRGMDALQVRDKEVNQKKLVEISKKIRKEFPKLFLILNGKPQIAADIGFEGLHMPDLQPSKGWIESYRVNSDLFLTTSIHNTNSLIKFKNFKFDAALLSPVKNTPSKGNQVKPLGWKEFKRLAKKIKKPTYALGGMSISDMEEAKKNGAQGLAMMGYFFNG